MDCGDRTIITKILDLYNAGSICFVGTRVNMIDFDTKNEIIKKVNNPDPTYPIKVEFNTSKNELIVCTRKDIKFINL